MEGVWGWFDKLGTVGSALASVAALLATLGFRKWGWPVITRVGRGVTGFFRGIGAIGELPQYMPSIQHLAAIEQTVQAIKKEVLPNGGSSMRDAISRIETDVAVAVGTHRAQWDGLGIAGIEERDARGQVVWASTTYLRWVGRGFDEIRSSGWVNVIVPEDRERVRAEWASCIADTRQFCMEFRLQHTDGEQFKVLATASPVLGSTGAVVKWVSVIQRRDAHGEPAC